MMDKVSMNIYEDWSVESFQEFYDVHLLKADEKIQLDIQTDLQPLCLTIGGSSQINHN